MFKPSPSKKMCVASKDELLPLMFICEKRPMIEQPWFVHLITPATCMLWTSYLRRLYVCTFDADASTDQLDAFTCNAPARTAPVPCTRIVPATTSSTPTDIDDVIRMAPVSTNNVPASIRPTDALIVSVVDPLILSVLDAPIGSALVHTVLRSCIVTVVTRECASHVHELVDSDVALSKRVVTSDDKPITCVAFTL
jgi:hypothetical protein